MTRKIAFMFPGQGSQAVGMGFDLYEEYNEVSDLFEAANDFLGFTITDLMFVGPEEELTKTVHTQPALVLQSVAILQLLEKEGIVPTEVVGHSLGEYSALVAAKVLNRHDAVKLVHKRGELMEKAYPAGEGKMAAVLGLSAEEIDRVIEKFRAENDAYVSVANYNCPGQIVISGTKEGIEQIEEIMKEAGARRYVPLNVSGPFHSELIKDASIEFKEALEEVSFQDAEIPVYANVTASPVTKGEEIKQLLVEQLYSPVRFEESIRKMIENGVEIFVEVGNGKVLTGLVRKIDRNVQTHTIQDVKSFKKFVTTFKGES